MEKIWIIMNEYNRHIVAWGYSAQEAYDKIYRAVNNSYKYSASGDQRRRECRELLAQSFAENPDSFSGFGYHAYALENGEIPIR